MEKAFFFENEGHRLFGYLHTPVRQTGSDGDTGYGMVLCHPFGDEHIAAYRTIRNFAVRFCQEGFFVLRFDYRGYGDSEGEFKEVTHDKQVSDIRKAIEVLQSMTGVKAVGLLGIRFGGILALLTTQLEPDVRFVIMWAPILSPSLYFQGILRQQTFSLMVNKEKRKTFEDLLVELNQNGKIDIGGYYLSEKAYTAFCGIDLMKLLQQTGQPVHIVLLEDDVTAIDRSILDQINTIGKSNVRTAVVHGEPFWRHVRDQIASPQNGFLQETINWLSTMNHQEMFSGNLVIE